MPSSQRRPSARRPGGNPAGNANPGNPHHQSGPPKPSAAEVAAAKARLFDVVDPVARAAGYDLEDLEVVRMGRRSVVRITVDRDGGVPLDAIAELARAVSGAIDEAEAAGGEIVAGEYQLEVSSPGVDRPLTAPRHWRRNIGRLVKVRVTTDEGARTLIGRVVEVTDDAVTMDAAGGVRAWPLAQLGIGRVEIEFSRIDDIPDDEMIEFEDSETDDDADDDTDEDEEEQR